MGRDDAGRMVMVLAIEPQDFKRLLDFVRGKGVRTEKVSGTFSLREEKEGKGSSIGQGVAARVWSLPWSWIISGSRWRYDGRGGRIDV